VQRPPRFLQKKEKENEAAGFPIESLIASNFQTPHWYTPHPEASSLWSFAARQAYREPHNEKSLSAPQLSCLSPHLGFSNRYIYAFDTEGGHRSRSWGHDGKVSLR